MVEQYTLFLTAAKIDKCVDIYLHTLEFVPEYYNTQKLCDKAADTHLATIKVVLECWKTQKIFYKAVHRWIFGFYSWFM